MVICQHRPCVDRHRHHHPRIPSFRSSGSHSTSLLQGPCCHTRSANRVRPGGPRRHCPLALRRDRSDQACRHRVCFHDPVLPCRIPVVCPPKRNQRRRYCQSHLREWLGKLRGVQCLRCRLPARRRPCRLPRRGASSSTASSSVASSASSASSIIPLSVSSSQVSSSIAPSASFVRYLIGIIFSAILHQLLGLFFRLFCRLLVHICINSYPDAKLLPDLGCITYRIQTR
jgi:hypothetical protein